MKFFFFIDYFDSLKIKDNKDKKGKEKRHEQKIYSLFKNM